LHICFLIVGEKEGAKKEEEPPSFPKVLGELTNSIKEKEKSLVSL